MSVGTPGTSATATPAAPTAVMRMGRFSPGGYFACHLTNSLDKFLGHPADR